MSGNRNESGGKAGEAEKIGEETGSRKDIAAEKEGRTAAVRLLDRQEHGKTRALWEEVFPEDSREFLDYYRDWVSDHNEIFVQEEQGAPVSMLQLNPYRVHMGDRLASVHYIVAVATKEEYRHQGRMRALLTAALRRLDQNGEPFTFLMPASEAIYLPFGFCTVGWQSMIAFGRELQMTSLSMDESPVQTKEAEALTSGDYHKRKIAEKPLVCRPCDETQLRELAEFSETFLRRHVRVYTERSVAYYQRIWREQQAMHGGILLLYRGDDLRGYCFTGCEDCAEAWEIAVEPEESGEAIAALTKWFGNRGQLPVKISGFMPGTEIPGIPAREFSCRPLTMIRIVNLEAFAKTLRAKRRDSSAEPLCAGEPVSFVLRISDPLLEGNQGCFRFQITETSGEAVRIPEISGEMVPILEQSKLPVSVGNSDSRDLSVLAEIPEVSIAEFGAYCCGVGETAVFPQEKLRCLAPVYLNELV